LFGITPSKNLCNWLQVEFLQLGLRHKDDSSGTIVERRGVRGGDGSSSRNEGGLHSTKLIGVKL
jgi:hypothetical protein